eukprot:COSAG05_NODE_209_length_14039_cov_138.574892_2_plen_64_part_00
MTKMIKKITFSVHIITSNSRGVWGSVVSKTARIQRLVTLARLVSQADTGASAREFRKLRVANV